MSLVKITITLVNNVSQTVQRSECIHHLQKGWQKWKKNLHNILKWHVRMHASFSKPGLCICGLLDFLASLIFKFLKSFTFIFARLNVYLVFLFIRYLNILKFFYVFFVISLFAYKEFEITHCLVTGHCKETAKIT